MEVLTLEKFLFQELEKIVPGKYVLSNILLRHPCPTRHKKGNSLRLAGYKDDWNLAMHLFPNGVTKIWCLTHCGLCVSSDDKERAADFAQLSEAMLHSTNYRSSSEVHGTPNPGPEVAHTPEHRERIKRINDMMLAAISQRVKDGTATEKDFIQVVEHPDPSVANQGPRKTLAQITEEAYAVVDKFKKKQITVNATVVYQDPVGIPALEPVTNTKIRKARKTQSRKRGTKETNEQP